MTVDTVDQLSPASDTTPTSTPVEVMTQSPASIPAEEPLLRVRVEDQLEVDRAVTLAGSVVSSRRRDWNSSSSRSCSFSRIASSPWRTSSWSLPTWARSSASSSSISP